MAERDGFLCVWRQGASGRQGRKLHGLYTCLTLASGNPVSICNDTAQCQLWVAANWEITGDCGLNPADGREGHHPPSPPSKTTILSRGTDPCGLEMDCNARRSPGSSWRMATLKLHWPAQKRRGLEGPHLSEHILKETGSSICPGGFGAVWDWGMLEREKGPPCLRQPATRACPHS